MKTFHSSKDGTYTHKDEKYNNAGKKSGPFTKGESVGMLLAAVLFVYAIINWDIPLACFLLAFILMIVHLGIERKGAEGYMHSLSNVLKGCSITMLIGSVVMLFV